jgi:hypothetical protein
MAAASSSGASAGAVRAGRAFIEIFANDKAVKSVLDRLRQRFLSFGKSISKIGAGAAALGGVVYAPLLGLLKSMSSAAGKATDLADRLGTTTDVIQGLEYVAIKSGGAIEDVEKSLFKLQNMIADGKEIGGLNLGNLVGMPLLDQLKAVADEVAKIEDATLQAGLAGEIFGKAAIKILPFLRQGSSGIDAMIQRSKDVGFTQDPDAVKNLDRIDDALEDILIVLKSIGSAIAIAFVGDSSGITDFSNTIINIGVSARAMIEEFRGVIQIVGVTAGALVAAGTVITGLGIAIIAAGTAIGFVTTMFSGLLGMVTFLVSPIGLIVAGLAAIGTSVAMTMIDFSALGESIKNAFGGIAEALKKGDLKTAMEIAWLGIRLVWETGVGFLEKIWVKFKFAFLRVFSEMRTGAEVVWETIKSAAIAVANAVITVFNAVISAVNTMLQAINEVGDQIGISVGLIDKIDSITDKSDWKAKANEGTARLKSLQEEEKKKVDAIDARKKTVEDELNAAIEKAKAPVAEEGESLWKPLRGLLKIKDSVQELKSPETGPVQGMFASSSRFADSLSIGADRGIEKHVEQTAKNTAKTNEILEKKKAAEWED